MLPMNMALTPNYCLKFYHAWSLLSTLVTLAFFQVPGILYSFHHKISHASASQSLVIDSLAINFQRIQASPNVISKLTFSPLSMSS